MLSRHRRRLLLERHLPYRLTAIDALRWACGVILRSPTPPQSIVISFNNTPVIRGNRFLLTNSIVESGLLMCRAVLEFLGIRADRDGKLVQRTGKARLNDLVIEDLGFAPVPLSALRRRSPDVPTISTRRAVGTALALASKAVAHFTAGPSTRREAARLQACAECVEWMADEYVYRRNGLVVPTYKIWTNPGVG